MPNMIMNKVFNGANDCNVKIYYQDTGSTHLNYDDVEPTLYIYIYIYIKRKYELYLVGGDLGNFHVDLDLDGAKSVYGIEIIFLGKKHT